MHISKKNTKHILLLSNKSMTKSHTNVSAFFSLLHCQGHHCLIYSLWLWVAFYYSGLVVSLPFCPHVLLFISSTLISSKLFVSTHYLSQCSNVSAAIIHLLPPLSIIWCSYLLSAIIPCLFRYILFLVTILVLWRALTILLLMQDLSFYQWRRLLSYSSCNEWASLHKWYKLTSSSTYFLHSWI